MVGWIVIRGGHVWGGMWVAVREQVATAGAAGALQVDGATECQEEQEPDIEYWLRDFVEQARGQCADEAFLALDQGAEPEEDGRPDERGASGRRRVFRIGYARKTGHDGGGDAKARNEAPDDDGNPAMARKKAFHAGQTLGAQVEKLAVAIE